MAATKKTATKAPVKKAKLDKWLVHQANELLAEAEAHKWSLPVISAELKKLGALSIETHTCCGCSWIGWPGELYSEHGDAHFGPYDNVAEKTDKAKVDKIIAYFKKPVLDHVKLAKQMVDAGVHAISVDFADGKGEVSRFDAPGKRRLLAKFTLDLDEKKLQHKNFQKMMDTFTTAGKEEWPHEKIFGALVKLGLDGFGFDVKTKQTVFVWEDGTRDYFDESGFYTVNPAVSAKLDPKAVSKAAKDFERGDIVYTDFMPALAKAGVAYYYTCLVDKKTIYWGKDEKQQHVEKIKVSI